MEGMLRALFSVLGIKPDEGKQMVLETFSAVKSVDSRLAAIEQKLGIVQAPLANGQQPTLNTSAQTGLVNAPANH